MKRFIGPAILGALLLSGCSSKPEPVTKSAPEKKEEHEHEHKPLTVEIDQQRANRFEFAEAQMRSEPRIIQTTGVITANDNRMAHVRPLSRGRVLRVLVRVGDRVKRGQELLSYDNIELGEVVGEYLRAAMVLERTKTESEVARRSWERAKNLTELGALAQAELDRRDAEFRNSQAAIQAQMAELARIDEKLHRFGLEEPEIEELLRKKPTNYHREYSTTVLRAPFDGIVLKTNAAEGESIQPEDQLFDVVDTSIVWVQADLYAQDLASVREGEMATVLLEGYADEKFQGRVTHISDAVNPESRTTRVRIELPNPNRRLKLDMFATIQLKSKTDRPVLAVPIGAIQQIDGKSVVFVRDGEKEFDIRKVQTGTESQGWIEITSGLKPGETIVTRGSFVLKSEHQKSELGEEGHAH